MTISTSRKTVTFRRPFVLCGSDKILPQEAPLHRHMNELKPAGHWCRSYKSIIAENTTLVLSPDSVLLKLLKGMSPDGDGVPVQASGVRR